MRLKTISRRSFLKGAGVAALAVAAAGMMTGCSSSSSSKKDPVTPVPTPTTKEVTVKYVLEKATGKEICTQTINVDVTKLNATNPTIPSSALTLPADFSTGYSIIEGDYPIIINDDKYEAYVYVKKESVGTDKDWVTIKYVTGGTSERDITADVVAAGGKDKITVPAGAQKFYVSELNLPDSYKFAFDADYAVITRPEEGEAQTGCYAKIFVKKV